MQRRCGQSCKLGGGAPCCAGWLAPARGGCRACVPAPGARHTGWTASARLSGGPAPLPERRCLRPQARPSSRHRPLHALHDSCCTLSIGLIHLLGVLPCLAHCRLRAFLSRKGRQPDAQHSQSLACSSCLGGTGRSRPSSACKQGRTANSTGVQVQVRAARWPAGGRHMLAATQVSTSYTQWRPHRKAGRHPQCKRGLWDCL